MAGAGDDMHQKPDEAAGHRSLGSAVVERR